MTDDAQEDDTLEEWRDGVPLVPPPDPEEWLVEDAGD